MAERDVANERDEVCVSQEVVDVALLLAATAGQRAIKVDA